MVDPDERKTLLFLGDLDERHGADLLLRAMPNVLRHHPQARLVLVGDGPLGEALAAYSRYLRLEEVVSFLPWQPLPDLDGVVQSADIVLIPGRQPVSSDALVKAWAARKPVIATHEAASGFAEHEVDALLVYPSENSIAAAILRILGDATLSRKLGEAGHQSLLDRFPNFPAGHVGP